MTWVVLGMERVPSPEPADTRGGIGGIFAFWNGQKTALGAGFAMGAPESPQDVACSSRLLQLLARPAPLPAAREPLARRPPGVHEGGNGRCSRRQAADLDMPDLQGDLARATPGLTALRTLIHD